MNKTSANPLPVGLTIAGYDPSGAAGILADIKTFSLTGIYGMAIPTCLTVQNFESVLSVVPVSDEYFERSLQHISGRIQLNGMKIGLVTKSSIIHILSSFLRDMKNIPVVLDPVIQSSSGFPFLDESVLKKLKSGLFPHITLLTPNLPELEQLSGIKIRSKENILRACKHLTENHRLSILVKGGHSEDVHHVTDYLYQPDKPGLTPYTFRRITSENLRGTGCILSSAITAFLAKGYPIEKAVEKARNMLHEIIQQNQNLKWTTTKGPLWHFPDEIPIL